MSSEQPPYVPPSQFEEACREWKRAGFWPRHRAPLEVIEGSVLEFGLRYFDRVAESKLRKALEVVQSDGGTLFLHGPRGTGKTQLAAYLAKAQGVRRSEHLKVDCSQRYWSWPEFMADTKREFDHPEMEGVADRARRSNLVIFDELQDGLRTEFEKQTLTRLIDYRYGHYLRTILIANLKADAIAEVIGASAYSRISETGAFLPCTWEPYR